MEIRFLDRSDAGRQLATALMRLEGEKPVVLGLARGGVVVAAEVARGLGASLDVMVARKVGAPSHPEYGIGAVAPGGGEVFDRNAVARLGISEEQLRALAARETVELERRLEAYRPEREPLDVADRTVILVDDGLATGITAIAAARYLRSLYPRRLVLAVPVCAPQSASNLADEVDEIVCLAQPERFYAVGQWYEDFSQTEDSEVLELLARAPNGGYLA
jgi:predicted phosphoribosyltransferase